MLVLHTCLYIKYYKVINVICFAIVVAHLLMHVAMLVFRYIDQTLKGKLVSGCDNCFICLKVACIANVSEVEQFERVFSHSGHVAMGQGQRGQRRGNERRLPHIPSPPCFFNLFATVSLFV